MTDTLRWGDDSLTIELAWSDDSAVVIRAVDAPRLHLDLTAFAPVVEVLTVAAGHAPASDRLDHTQIGRRLRYASHSVERDDAVERLRLVQRSDADGLSAELVLELPHGTGAIRSHVVVTNTGERRHVLRQATSWSSAIGGSDVDDWSLLRGRSEWLGEARWKRTPLRTSGLAVIREDLTGHDRRSSVTAAAYGTWSTSGDLPVGVLESPALGAAWIWQIEHNGPWRWEVGEDIDGGVLALSGPTDRDHAFTITLEPGESFTTVPVALAWGTDIESALARLTDYRRATRLAHPDNAALGVVFNDYMNTLDGDPTTEKLLPLIDAAADVGAEIFCIDAGWYDDSGAWWASVGEWQPSTVRFPGGLDAVIRRIQDRGMVAGLWLEPEVVGVHSPIADSLPAEAFLQRGGVRVEEHERFHLDLRHPAARAHLDAVVDRLVADFGVGFFKFDYNINPGSGTDLSASSPGLGLLEHNRAHLAWIDALYERHPDLIIENCSSGAMRSDFALLSRLQMQSTSDQQDYRLYPPIAAAAPLSMLPEQAASWAYPQPEMSDEEVAFCLVTGLLGRFYLSGYLNRMSEEQLALVREAVAAAQSLRTVIPAATPFWPLAATDSIDGPVALGLAHDGSAVVSVWSRRAGSEPISLALPAFRGEDVHIDALFPQRLDAWETQWSREEGVLTVRPSNVDASARTFRVTTSRS
ncbi:alpha-galactosidase [Agromyces atrinae]|uniref:glycoside hydrolase family 36 protein n=1 Tax=Agromyces atrinae TaxID=592376 RepID=UPI001F566892|nr:glycoside hydrolase family 36 protein [Agromyces atrinae]MCI2959484.1 alpha-galactosidase [Agromyces atrinae]